MDQKEEILALGHTLLSYSGKNDSFTIPTTENNDSITRVGDGALYGNSCVRSLRIPKGIRQIGTKAFFGCQLLKIVYLEGILPDFSEAALKNCPNLQKIQMKDLPVPEDLYQQMCLDSVELEDGKRITESFPAIPRLDRLSQALDVQRAACLPKEIHALFHGLPGADAPELSRNEKEAFLRPIRFSAKAGSGERAEQRPAGQARQIIQPGKGLPFRLREGRAAFGKRDEAAERIPPDGRVFLSGSCADPLGWGYILPVSAPLSAQHGLYEIPSERPRHFYGKRTNPR